jgi:hypothetical protein
MTSSAEATSWIEWPRSMIIRPGPLGDDTFAQKKAAFSAALKLPGLRCMLGRARVERRSKRGRFGDQSGAEMGWGKNAGNLNLCEIPTADWLQEQRTLIFDTTYDCRFGQGTSVPVQRPLRLRGRLLSPPS